MDESLSEFQEKKSTRTGPKKSEKPAVKKTKTKKPPKKIRGQKDIRAVLNNKNELIKYSKDFEKVCKEAAVDVDSEQLQLAIALSKSLQQIETSDPQASTSLSTQERQAKIRKTLLEYGFKVPEIKISLPKSKKHKSRLHYKLISVSDSEKKQIISDRCAQILLTTLHNNTSDESTDTSIQFTTLFGKATNVPYENLKSDDIFYVDQLLEKTSNTTGCLLRKWSEIPGRPPSPSIETVNINFDSIDCSPSELDTILRGTLEVAQKIIRDKDTVRNKESVDNISGSRKDKEMGSKCPVLIEDDNIIIDPKYCKKVKETLIDLCQNEIRDNFIKGQETITQMTRTCSPDIFDDDDVTIINDSYSTLNENKCIGESTVLSQTTVSNNFGQLYEKESKRNSNEIIEITEYHSENVLCISQKFDATKRNSNDFMEITDAIEGNVVSQKSQGSNYTKRKSYDSMEITEYKGGNILSQLSQNSNKSQRKSNDFMETTQNIEKTILSQRIDTTKRKTNDCVEITECLSVIPHSIDKAVQCVDLTQPSHKENVEIKTSNHEHSNVDLTQSSYSSDYSDTLPFIDISGKNKSPVKTPLCLTDDENKNLNNADKISLPSGNNAYPITCSPLNNIVETDLINIIETNENDNYVSIEVHENTHFDCSKPQENIDSASPQNMNSNFKSENQSFFEEYSFQHSEESSKKENSENSSASPNQTDVSEEISRVSEHSVDLTETYETPVKIDFNDDIDLTQSTDTSVSVNDDNKSTEARSTNTEKLRVVENITDYDEVHLNGNIGDVSVDYDELFDNIGYNNYTSKSINYINKPSNNRLVSREATSSNNDLSSSQNSEVFNISDNELDYSIQKSRRENFDLGGLSVIDNISNINVDRSKSVNDVSNFKTDALGNSFLPEVHLQGTDTKIIKGKDSISTYSKSQPTFSRQKNLESIVNECDKTPLDQKYIVKMNEVTPIVDYVSLSTPEITKELDRYGVKPLKRRRAVQLLTHIYNQTHPTVEICSDDIVSPSKRRKTVDNEVHSPKKTHKKFPRKLPLTSSSKNKVEDLPTESNKENSIYEVTSEVPVITDLECAEEEWVFQKREKAKLHSCRVPLHITFHNYVSARRCLREAILRYEPINIDVVHKGLVANGYRYDPKDLLKYMDKKCITVKTADSSVKSRKHY